MVIDMQKIMECPAPRCTGEIGLTRTVIKKSLVTGLETESYVVGCDTCPLTQFIVMNERIMSGPELHRLARPEEFGYEHG